MVSSSVFVFLFSLAFILPTSLASLKRMPHEEYLRAVNFEQQDFPPSLPILPGEDKRSRPSQIPGRPSATAPRVPAPTCTTGHNFAPGDEVFIFADFKSVHKLSSGDLAQEKSGHPFALAGSDFDFSGKTAKVEIVRHDSNKPSDPFKLRMVGGKEDLWVTPVSCDSDDHCPDGAFAIGDSPDCDDAQIWDIDSCTGRLNIHGYTFFLDDETTHIIIVKDNDADKVHKGYEPAKLSLVEA